MARGSVIRRCKICRRLGKSGFNRCSHKEAEYLISYRIGNKQIRETIGRSKKDAERILNQRVSEINNGSYFQPKEILFRDYIEKWLEDYCRPRIKEQTLYKYKNTMNKILHNFGFGVVLKGETTKPKRTKESILFVREDGLTLGVEYSLPEEREKTIQEGYQKYSKAKYVNVIPLRGRHIVIEKEIV